MANPQIENGYIRISNELFMAIIKSGFNASEIRVLLFILSQTFGYNKKSRRLSASYISMGADLPIGTVRRSLQTLIDKKVVNVSCEYNNSIKTIGINKDYSKWRLLKNEYSKMTTQIRVDRLLKNEQSDYSKMSSNKRQTIKDRKERQSSSRQQPPTLDEISAYVSQRGYTFSAEKFFLSHEATGWIANNGEPIANWKALCDIWQMNERNTERKPVKTIFGKEVKEDKWQ